CASFRASRPPPTPSCLPGTTPIWSHSGGAAPPPARSTGVKPMGDFEKLQEKLKAWFAAKILVPFWAWRQPTKPLPGGPRYSVQPGDNVQRMMNLIMPLKDKSPIGRALAAQAVAESKDEIYAGLDNVGTVHFARFVIVDDNICMFSVYD